MLIQVDLFFYREPEETEKPAAEEGAAGVCLCLLGGVLRAYLSSVSTKCVGPLDYLFEHSP